MNIDGLIGKIRLIDSGLKREANKSVNQLLTIRNWLIGYYIVVYEQEGDDRAKYGKRLIKTLSDRISIKGLSSRNLNLFRKFYLSYPEILQLLTAKSSKLSFPIMKVLLVNIY